MGADCTVFSTLNNGIWKPNYNPMDHAAFQPILDFLRYVRVRRPKRFVLEEVARHC